MSYRDDEHIVCEFLREISPSREWRYLAEVEHYWIDKLCESIREHERAENAKLRELCAENAKLRELCWRMRTYMAGVVEHNGYQIMTTGYTMLGSRIDECDKAMQAFGIEVDQ